MENLVVGSEECKIVEIVAMMMDSPTTTTIRENWRRLAISLDVWEASWKLGQDLALNLTDFNGVFASLLIEWKSNKAQDATLGALLHIFCEECKWKDLAESVRQRYDIARSKKSKQKTYDQPPSIVVDFRKPENSRLTLAINTQYPDEVSRWICETLDNCQVVDRHGFVELCDKTTSSSTSVGTTLPVIKHSAGELRTLQLISARCKHKCVIVGSIPRDTVDNEHLQKCEINICWDDLSCFAQLNIQDMIKCELGIGIDESLDIVRGLHTSSIMALINGKVPEMLKCSIPDPLPYYIPRRLVPRNCLRIEVLMKDDVFLISGLSCSELHLMVKKTAIGKSELENENASTYETRNDTTQTSGSILTYGDTHSRYIVLDELAHVDKLFKLESLEQKHIHHLEWTMEQFIWRKTRGSIIKLQKYVIKEVEHIPEVDMIRDNRSVQKVPSTVLISDTPGMGKTVLLANIARALKNHGVTIKVVFVVISELIQIVRDKHNSNPENILLAFLDHISTQHLARHYLQMNVRSIQHVLLDAFDELTMEECPLGYECLRNLRKQLPETTIWVTTRPHLLILLERELFTLGYNIPPLDNQDQINFLTRFWNMNETSYQLKKATEFAKEVLKNISNNLNESEEQIAGIPLQCMLIGEIYKQQALDFCCDKITSPEIITITSLTDLFAGMIHQKYESFQNRYTQRSRRELIDRTHAYFSFQLLFPAHVKILKKEEFQELVSAEGLFNVGILASASVFPMPKFIHRTFAEYFVAKFVSNGLQVLGKKKILAVFIGNILALGKSTLIVKQYDFGSVKSFKFPVVCYFINSMLMKWKGDCTSHVEMEKKYNNMKLDTKRLNEIAEACANEQCEYIYSKVFHAHLLQISISATLLKTVTIRASASHAWLVYDTAGQELVENVIIKGKRNKSYNSFNLLQISVLRGLYALVELLYKFNFHKYGNAQSNPITDYLHKCIEDTLHLGEKAINDALQTFHLLNHALQSSIAQHSYDEFHPLECDRVHPKLFFTVVEHFELAQYEKVGKLCVEKTLFLATKSLDAQHYIVLINLVESHSGLMHKSMFNYIHNGVALLHQIADKIELTEEFTEVIKRWDPVVPKCTPSNNLLITAIKSGKNNHSICLLAKLFKFNSKEMLSTLKLLHERKRVDLIPQVVNNMDAKDSTKALRYIVEKVDAPTLIHFCEELLANGADIGSASLMHVCASSPVFAELLVNAGANVNECNELNETPLHDAIARKKPYEYIHFLVSRGANVNSVDNKQRTPLMNVRGLNRTIVHLLVQSGANVHACDCNAWTTLHHAAKEYDLYYSVFKCMIEGFEELLLSGANPNAVNNDGNTPLHLARNVDIVTSLLHKGADPNAVNNDGNTPLHLAKNGHVVTALVGKGADPNAVNHDGNTPLHLEKYDSAVIALLDKGADPNAVNKDGNTPLHCQFDVDVVTSLLQKGADPNTRNILGQTPLMFYKSPYSMRVLLEKGADVNAVDKQGNTVFRHVVKNDSKHGHEFPEILKILMKSGINPTSPNNMNDTIVYIFGPGKYSCKYVKRFMVLLSADINLSVQDRKGNTVFYCFEHMTTEGIPEAQEIFNLVVVLIEKGYFEQLKKPNASGTSAWFHLSRLLNPYKELDEKLVELEEHNVI